MKIDRFDWDEGNREKVEKHGVKKNEIEKFFSQNPFIRADELHSVSESRFIAFDRFKERHLFVVFTIRALKGSIVIRVISARFAHEKEVKSYEKIKN